MTAVSTCAQSNCLAAKNSSKIDTCFSKIFVQDFNIFLVFILFYINSASLVASTVNVLPIINQQQHGPGAVSMVSNRTASSGFYVCATSSVILVQKIILF